MNIVHLCAYPGKGEKHIADSGVASYTKNLLTNLPQGDETRHYVLAARINGKQQQWREGGVTVIRCFDRSWRFVIQVHRQLKAIQPDVVHIQHELALFGGLLSAYILLFLIFLWRRKTIVTLHGVVDIGRVDGSFVRANGYAPSPVWAVKLGLRLLYWPLAHWPKRIIVHEPYFKHLLTTQYGASPARVAVIPHGVEDFTPVDKQTARSRLAIAEDQKVVLFMGYAAGYKGIDLLIQGFAEFAKTEPKALLLIGAGVHPKLKHDAAHLAAYAGYQQDAKTHIAAAQYRWVGFIPEQEVNIYYSAADVSVYPYTTALASSGPMAFALGFSQPFLVSTAFSDIFDEELVFKPTPQGLADKLHQFFAGQGYFDTHIATLRSERLWQQVGLQTSNVYRQIG